ncbi:efflux RND transporter periplasmic adaptor subunit [Dokdonella fugitiva]|uniref:efflux RND transporter periplasmic adaptor subunit n=1 Tax=Dokdonella fugitiva TaxID=328517 RepID=UPI0015FD563B|nr:efflux RND transporter periplasmic adaptor subunit [Dokdonella fugitiva]MBA8882360.1 RND family efflux transporter MFP subunit [Dokdonella fugitiva]
MEKSDLLQQLRIDRNAPAAHAGRGAGVWIGALVGVLVLGIGAVGGWWFLRDAKAIEVEAVTANAPSAAGTGPLAVLQATGYVTARRQATVSAQITGTLVDVLIEEGERVESGQVLAHLEDTAQRAQLAQAEAGYRAAQAQLAQVAAQLAQSRRDVARAEELVGRKLVSKQAVELARTQVDAQAAQLESQRRQVDVAMAAVDGARVQLDYCTVRAPFAGVVIAKAAQPGEIVSPLSAGGGFTRTGVGTIVDMDSLEVEVDVNESYINRVAAKQPVEAVLDAYPDWKIPGHVIAIIPTADRGKATVKVRVAMEQKDARIVPDMGVRVSFLEDSAKSQAAVAEPPKGVLVPSSSVVQRDGRSVVFALDGDRARLRPVTPGQAYADQRLVEGIGLGTRIVRQPTAELVDGARVAIRK